MHPVGASVGLAEGESLGDIDGEALGEDDGNVVGLLLGDVVGDMLGDSLGWCVDGASVGVEGATVEPGSRHTVDFDAETQLPGHAVQLLLPTAGWIQPLGHDWHGDDALASKKPISHWVHEFVPSAGCTHPLWQGSHTSSPPSS